MGRRRDLKINVKISESHERYEKGHDSLMKQGVKTGILNIIHRDEIKKIGRYKLCSLRQHH